MSDEAFGVRLFTNVFALICTNIFVTCFDKQMKYTDRSEAVLFISLTFQLFLLPKELSSNNQELLFHQGCKSHPDT